MKWLMWLTVEWSCICWRSYLSTCRIVFSDYKGCQHSIEIHKSSFCYMKFC